LIDFFRLFILILPLFGMFLYFNVYDGVESVGLGDPRLECGHLNILIHLKRDAFRPRTDRIGSDGNRLEDSPYLEEGGGIIR